MWSLRALTSLEMITEPVEVAEKVTCLAGVETVAAVLAAPAPALAAAAGAEAVKTRVSKPAALPFLDLGRAAHCLVPSRFSNTMPGFSSVLLVAPLMVSCGFTNEGQDKVELLVKRQVFTSLA